MMSIRIKNIWVIMVLFAVVVTALPVVSQEEVDDILLYYQKRANEVFQGRNPILSGVNFSFKATTYNKVYGKDEKTHIVDSTIAIYYYSFENLDSIITKIPSGKKMDAIDISYPNIFTGSYVYNFYPNDTGGDDIAIGYDSKSFDTTIPVGIAMLDRDYYFLTRLYLHYMNDKRVDRSSKAYRFTEFEGFVFPDSIWEIKSRRSFLTTEYYRIETGISNIHIFR